MEDFNEQYSGGTGFGEPRRALVRLEHTAGTPVPVGSLRLWSAELNGDLRRVKRTWPALIEDLEGLRDDMIRNDDLRRARVQQLQQATEQAQAELATLLRTVERLAHSRFPESPVEFAAANSVRNEVLDWIVATRALIREHEEWHSRTLQVDIGGPG